MLSFYVLIEDTRCEVEVTEVTVCVRLLYVTNFNKKKNLTSPTITCCIPMAPLSRINFHNIVQITQKKKSIIRSKYPNQFLWSLHQPISQHTFRQLIEYYHTRLIANTQTSEEMKLGFCIAIFLWQQH